jgi:hypothetical protein
MPHQLPDSMLPGERLEVGEFLVSPNGRFRLYFENDGYLFLWGYHKRTGKYPMWGSGNAGGGPGTKFDLPVRGNGVLVRPDGQRPIVVHPNFSNVDNHRLVLQDDGNFVLYGIRNGNTFAQWSSGTALTVPSGGLVVPNTCTVEIKAGTIALDTATGDGDVLNNSGSDVGITDDTNFKMIPAGGAANFYQAGEVRIETIQYDFPSLHDDGLPQTQQQRVDHNTADALPRLSRGTDGRFHAKVISGFQLRVSPLLDPVAPPSDDGIDFRVLLEESGRTSLTNYGALAGNLIDVRTLR